MFLYCKINVYILKQIEVIALENLKELLMSLNLEKQLILEEIPGIDLYMDQVIQLFENTFEGTKRKEEDKVLTKTMINNYAKGKLLIPIKNKKYSKEHLILISLIYQLKGALSISDIKSTLTGLNKKIGDDEINLNQFYNSFLKLAENNIQNFQDELDKRYSDVVEEGKSLADGNSSALERILLVSSLVHMSNLYRRVAEKLVDEIVAEEHS